jgi:molybdopterin-guanine dinucleotide biosynthesis protein A
VARRDVTGVLLVGGASRRFGSPKALAVLDGETLAERTWRTLAAAFEDVIAVGKTADALPLPFPVEDDGSELRASIAGVAAALRLARHEVVVILPVDVPFVTPALLTTLADAAEDAAFTQTGPLPAAFHRRALPVLERRIAAGELALRDALAELQVREIHGNPEELRNVNTVEDLQRLASSQPRSSHS